MIIRWSELKDLERMVEIYNYEIVHGTASFAIPTTTVERRKKWFEEHDRDIHPLIVAEEDGKVIGYASLSAYRSEEAYDATAELSIYIDSDYRGRRVGEALVTNLLKLARDKGRIHAVLSVITGDNQASIRLHEKLGFTCCERLKEVGYKFGRWLDTVTYELIL